ncbi:hypothetical protein BLA29_010557 [Euroglyphus maynei]|uniref:Uncharacterized protein n=1 Tax=Euroglyphus maynei TaxID=6958 RepID=A0A1Y3B1P4_EURMA|nr:hypothetical protein BLA29_010557 [Euroglyphus maynei]
MLSTSSSSSAANQSASAASQQVNQQVVDRFSYLLRKCSSSSSSNSSTSTTFHPIINRVTRIGSAITANLRIRDPENIDKIQAEIHQITNDNPFDHNHNNGQKFNILKVISHTKPTFLNGRQQYPGIDTILQHQDRITFVME